MVMSLFDICLLNFQKKNLGQNWLRIVSGVTLIQKTLSLPHPAVYGHIVFLKLMFRWFSGNNANTK